MPTREQLRRKYPKWAHRRDHKKRKRKRKRKKRVHTKHDLMLLALLQDMMNPVMPLHRKHGENVLSGYSSGVKPDSLAPVRSRAYHKMMQEERERGGEAALTGASAAVLAAPGGVGAVPNFTTF